MSKNLLLAIGLGITLVIVTALGVFYLLKIRYPNIVPSKQTIVIQNEVPGFTFDFKDKVALVSFLDQKGLWEVGKTLEYSNTTNTFTTKKVTIIFTDKPSSNPFFIQNDTKNNLIISSELQTNPQKGEITITIVLGEFLLKEEEKERIPLWTRSRFWQSLSLVSKGISKDETTEVFKLQ
jgi:hypothetical protein